MHSYWGSIAGPLVDRIDIHVGVPAAEFIELASKKPGTSSAEIRELVEAARKAQIERFSGLTILYNAQMSSKQIRQFCKLNKECMDLLKHSVNELGASVAVLLVSPNFLNSDFIAETELPRLLEAAKNAGATIVWVPISYSLVEETEIAKYQAALDPNNPLDSMSDSDVNKALLKVCQIINKAAGDAAN